MTATQKKPTLATLKAWLKKNSERATIKVKSSFDGMTDGIETNRDARWYPLEGEFDPGCNHSGDLGFKGVWVVGQSRDRIQHYTDAEGFEGFEVSNCCGRWFVAIPPVGWAFVPDWLMPHYPVDAAASDVALEHEPEPENIVPFALAATPEPAQDKRRHYTQQAMCFAETDLFTLR